MYRIAPPPPLPPTPKKWDRDPSYCAVDSDRNLTVRHIATSYDQTYTSWLFQHHDVLVPFGTSRKGFAIEDGRWLVDIVLESFGWSKKTEHWLGIDARTFESEDQKREWSLLAVEGVLAIEEYGSRELDQRPRIQALDRTWMIEDFDYTEGDFHDNP